MRGNVVDGVGGSGEFEQGGWGISFDVGVTTALGDDASLVSVGLNLEWIATQD